MSRLKGKTRDMELTSTVLFQVIVMLLLIAVGITAYRLKLVTEGGKTDIKPALYIVMPGSHSKCIPQ